ncbi:hypothetical protein [Methanobrevibacter arboriphilus]|uniref:hypothetical protein n=1 Tax=Methanobrevibacter arboriphilus TaxID=39441 RepID=UPI0012E2FDEF|nr:hypothetical protein [Methanobrevibacter arboriphilus]
MQTAITIPINQNHTISQEHTTKVFICMHTASYNKQRKKHTKIFQKNPPIYKK